MIKIKTWFKKYKGLIMTFFYFIFLCLATTYFIIYIDKNTNINNVDKILELLKILISWPLLGIFIFSIFLFKFYDGINEFLCTHKITGAAGVTLAEKQISETITSVAAENSPAITANLVTVSASAELSAQKVISENWNFKYLSVFFVENTKKILKWFYETKNDSMITKENLEKIWWPMLGDNFSTTIDVLLKNNTISLNTAGEYKITELGEKFLKFIKYI